MKLKDVKQELEAILKDYPIDCSFHVSGDLLLNSLSYLEFLEYKLHGEGISTDEL